MKTRPSPKRLKYFNFLFPIALGFSLVCPNFQAIAQDSRSAANITAPSLDDAQKAALLAATSSTYRIDKARDEFRHPAQTLEFFGIKPSDSVIEVWPGQGWYSSILGAYLKSGNGKLIAAHFDTTTSSSNLVRQIVDGYKARFVDKPQSFGDVSIVGFGPRSEALGPENSADAVLTFRNIHNWMAQGWAEKAFDDFYKVLKPGGILGIEEHRGDNNSPQDPLANDGYVREDFVIDMALEAGFVLVASSEINANPKDTKDHPFGVWTLPPVSRTSPQGQPNNPAFDQRMYDAIGESDRMTLVFRKPLLPAPTIIARNQTQANSPFPVRVVLAGPTNIPRTPVAPPAPRAQSPAPARAPNLASPIIVPTPTPSPPIIQSDPVPAPPTVPTINAPPAPDVPAVIAPTISAPPIANDLPPTITAPSSEPPQTSPQTSEQVPPPASEAPALPRFSVPSWQVREVPPPPPPPTIVPQSNPASPTPTPPTRSSATSRRPATVSTAPTNPKPLATQTTTQSARTSNTTPQSTRSRSNLTKATRNAPSQTSERSSSTRPSSSRANTSRTNTSSTSTARTTTTRPTTTQTTTRATPKTTKATTAPTRRPTTAAPQPSRSRPTTQPKTKTKAPPSNVPSWNPPPKKKK